MTYLRPGKTVKFAKIDTQNKSNRTRFIHQLSSKNFYKRRSGVVCKTGHVGVRFYEYSYMGIFGTVVRGNFATGVTMVRRQSSKTCVVWRKRLNIGGNTGDMVGPYCFYGLLRCNTQTDILKYTS